jgi:peptidoglycan hydrolase-like protein with peptidoglycan-binding domain
MAFKAAEPHGLASRPRGRRRGLLVFAGAAALVIAGLVVVVMVWSGATLSSDPTALAKVELQPFAGTLVRAAAFGPDGRSIPVAVHDGRLTPLAQITPGELISVNVTIRRPGWLGWALGSMRLERLTLRAPVARVSNPWLTVAPGSPVRVRFDQPVSTVAYGSGGYLAVHQTPPSAVRTVSLGVRDGPGTLEIAAAVRPWEKLSAPVAVTWFPPSRSPVMVASPAPGTQISPTAAIHLTFSQPLAQLLGSSLPQLSPSTPGSWRETDTHTLVFTPSGFGAPLGSELRVVLPRAVAVTQTAGSLAAASAQFAWTVPPGSTLRLQQLLAQAGYLPLDWTSASAPVAPTAQLEAAAAVAPPSGAFTWRYLHTPRELRALWNPASPNQITRGAVMTFEHTHGLAVDGLAGPMVWRALMTDALTGRRSHAGYSYVYVHRKVPQLLTLWSNGHTVLTSPGNTGVPAAPTVLGTFPVFEHIPVGVMSGTNPDGSHYHDPGIRFISYFNGGDAIHAFNRASFGTPQSLGCVELPLAAAAKVWPYTPIGTLVTVEN